MCAEMISSLLFQAIMLASQSFGGTMFRVKQVAVCVPILLALSATASAQPDVSGFDQPCVAPFGPLSYPQLNRFVPNEANPAARARVRGVVARSLLWRPGDTLKVCFRSGTQKARARVVRLASEWLQHANLKLDFGDTANPHMCQGDNHETIKIDFVNTGPKAGFWSAVGKVSLKTDHSMNLSFLGEDDLPRHRVTGQSMPEAEARRLILHEFGHALGLFHEHQSPRSGCNAEFYEEAVIAYGALRGWPPDRSKQNMMQHADRPELNATEVDRKSIMHYALPPWLFKAGEKSPCFVPPNFELSEGDKAFMAKVYPKATDPQVATGPTTSTMRGAKPPAAAVAIERLLEDYRRSLQEAGVETDRRQRLVKDFKASLTK